MLILSIVIGCALLYRLQAFLYGKYWRNNLNVSCQFVKHQITEGDSIRVHLFVENRKWLPMPTVLVGLTLSEHFVTAGQLAQEQKENQNVTELFSVLMNQRIVRSLDYVCRRRGYYQIPELAVKCGDFFNHTQFSETFACSETLTVYPGMVEQNRFVQVYQNLYGQVLTRQFLQEDPFLHRGIREYQSFDTMKQIHWKATARTGELKVHVPERTAYREVVIFLNLQCDRFYLEEDVMEESIRLAKTFCAAFDRDGIRCRIYTNGHDIVSGEYVTVEHAGADVSYMHLVNGSLARIRLRSYHAVAGDQEFAEDQFVGVYGEHMRREAQRHCLLVISNYQHAEFQTLLQELLRQGGELLWLVPVGGRKDYHPEKNLLEHTRMWNLNYKGNA